MEIKRAGSQPSGKPPGDWFTGTVRIDPLFQAPDPALGQTLIVTAGCGWAQHEGGPVEEIRPGDVIWFPPKPTTAMTNIAIQEKQNGKVVDWLEKVTDDQYRR